MKEIQTKIDRNKRLPEFSYKDFITSSTDEVCSWLSFIGKNEDNLLKIIKSKDITGEEIGRIVDAFLPLIERLKIKGIKPKKKTGILPPGWKEVVSPSGEAFFFNTKTGMNLYEAPEMCVSDLPFSNFKGKPSVLDIFQRMEPDFYEPLDKAFESASFEDADAIRKRSQNKAKKLETNGVLDQLGMSREEAEVLFSYTYEAKRRKNVPCYIMNKILAERDDNKARAHRGYILHLLKALRRLKPISTIGTTLYRGIDGKFVKFDEEHYKVGNIMTWPAFTSTARKEDVAYRFMKRAAQPIIFEIHGAFVGYDIKPFSKFLNEEEILLEPETTFRVVSIQSDAKNSKAKRIIVEVQPTPLMIKEAVENFVKNEWNLYRKQKNTLVLPPNWEMRGDPKTGRSYYANNITKRTQWNFPTL